MTVRDELVALREKHEIALKALREISKRAREGSCSYPETSDECEYYSGYDSGLESQGDIAEDALNDIDKRK